MLKLLKLILDNDVFTFDNNISRQKSWVTMGGTASMDNFDLQMFKILENILRQLRQRNKTWYGLGTETMDLMYLMGSQANSKNDTSWPTEHSNT